MLSYTKIIKDSYRVTVHNKFLWLFGAFVLGSFNANFLHFQDVPLKNLSQPENLHAAMVYFQTHPGKLALVSSSVLVVSLAGLVLTNWCRIMLVLLLKQVLEKNRFDLPQEIKNSGRHLRPVISISLLTTGLMLVVAVSLVGGPWAVAGNLSYKALLWALGGVIFLPLAFTISCVNIFTIYFVLFFGHGIKKALDLGTDFFVSNWSSILGLSFLLIIIYVACFGLGAGIIGLGRVFLESFTGPDKQFGFLGISAIIMVLKLVLGLFLWVLLAGLNVFFNSALLMFFMQTVTPVKKTEGLAEAKNLATAPLTP